MSARLCKRIAWLAGAIVLLVVCGAGWLWWSQMPMPPVISEDGVDREVVEAIRAARQQVVASPRKATHWGHLGMLLRVHSYGEEANFCFEQAEKLDAKNPRWPYYRGLTMVLTDPTNGLVHLRRAVEKLEDRTVAPRFRLVEVLLEQGLLDEAKQQLKQAQDRQPEHPRGELLQARLALLEGDWKGVLTATEGCIQHPRAAKQATLLAAEASRRLGEAKRADELVERARQMADDQPWIDTFVEDVERLQVGMRVRLARAQQLEMDGRVQESLKLLDQTTKDYPKEASAWLQMGQLYRQLKQLSAAERALLRAVELDPSVEGWFQLGIVRVFQNNTREAVEAFREVVGRKSDHGLAYHNLGICLKKLGEREAARKAFQDALRCQPDYAPSQQALKELAK